MKANILVEARFQPRRVDLGSFPVGQVITKTATFDTRDPSKIKITTVEILPIERRRASEQQKQQYAEEIKNLTAKIVKINGQQALEVSYKGEKRGRVRGRLKVTTTSDKIPELTLHVSGRITGNWDIQPPRVSFRHPGDEPEPQTRKISIHLTTERRHKITKVFDPEGIIKTKLKRTDKGYDVLLTLDSDPQKRRGIIKIETNDPEDPVLEARYLVRSRQKRRIPPRPVPGRVQPPSARED